MRAVVFSGTTEGRAFSRALAALGAAVTVCVATELGAEEQGCAEGITVRTGRQDAEEMAALLREEAALTPEQRALRRQKVTAFTQRYGEKEFIRAVLNVYERAMAEYKAKMKIKAKAKSKGVR